MAMSSVGTLAMSSWPDTWLKAPPSPWKGSCMWFMFFPYPHHGQGPPLPAHPRGTIALQTSDEDHNEAVTVVTTLSHAPAPCQAYMPSA